jgi:prophage antirepressor-like protein
MSVFIDIFNNLLKYNEKNIFIIIDKNNQIWFKLKDVLKMLNYTNLKKALYSSFIDEKNKKKYRNIKVYPSRGTPLNAQPSAIFIDEAGLYKLLTNSTKELAKKFRDEIFSNILPTIRKTGSYNVENKDKTKLKQLNNEIIQLKNNQRNIVYPKGKAIYVIKQKINNNSQIYYKIGYTKDLNKRLKIYNTGNPNKILYKYFCLIKDESIDKCIKNVLKNKEFIKNKEHYVINKKQIINVINKCDKRIKIICCGYCLKCKKLETIIKHKCKYIN